MLSLDRRCLPMQGFVKYLALCAWCLLEFTHTLPYTT